MQPRRILLAPITAALAACSGGTSIETVSGQVIGSYYRNALVCIDSDGDGRCGPNEASTRSGAQGEWTLPVPGTSAGYVAEIGADAIRVVGSTTTPVDRPIVFRVHPKLLDGGTVVMSALSTALTADIESGLSADDARKSMAERIGVSPAKLGTDFNRESDDAIRGLLVAQSNRTTALIQDVVANARDRRGEMNSALTAMAPSTQQGTVKYAWTQIAAPGTPFSKLEFTGLDTGGSLTDDPTKVDNGAAHPIVSLESPNAPLYAAGTIWARAIVAPDAQGRANCPSIVLNGVAKPMTVRASPVKGVTSPGSRYGSSIPVDFNVLTCEAAMPPGTTTASIAGSPLKVPSSSRNLQRIVVVGDTGCRLKGPTAFVQTAEGVISGGDPLQDCTSEAAWPWAKIARLAASFEPDLILHNGDLHYREGFPEGVEVRFGGAANAANGGSERNNTTLIKPKFVAAKIDDSVTYGWRAWEEDFFKSAGPLLGVAPWAITRGNHESCDRAAQGWFRFLDPRNFPAGEPEYDAAYKPGTSYSNSKFCSQYIDPVAMQLGDLQLVLLDVGMMNSAPGLNSSKGATNVDHVRVARQLSAIAALPASTDENVVSWVVSHKPFFAYSGSAAAAGNVPKSAGADTWQLQKAIATGTESVASGNGKLPANTQMTHAGHIHGFQMLSFPPAANLPINVLMGTTGDNLEGLIEANTGTALAKAAFGNDITAGAWPWFDQLVATVTVRATKWYGAFASVVPVNFSSSAVTGGGARKPRSTPSSRSS